MKRSISVTLGDGNINHNNRVFITENVDKSRTANNITFVKENIEDVYHELFDKALEEYNARQTRKDRRIENYYKHILRGKQEKPFYELIVQIGNKDDTSVSSNAGKLTTEILKEYAEEFQKNNAHLRLYNATLHLDEASPHIHLDFIPFATEQKRGLSTRVSLSKALEQQGFKSKGKNNLCTNQWIDSEKERLSTIMKRYGIEWEKLGTHNEHLSVLDYKKKQRQKEIEELEKEVVETKERLTSENKHSVALRQKSRREYAIVQKTKAETEKKKDDLAIEKRVLALNKSMFMQMLRIHSEDKKRLSEEMAKIKTEYLKFTEMKERFIEVAKAEIIKLKDESKRNAYTNQIKANMSRFELTAEMEEYVSSITKRRRSKDNDFSL